MIKAVFFDVGSTLIDANPDIDGVFHQVATERGHVLSLESVVEHMPTINRFYEEEYLRDGDFWCSPEGSAEMYLKMYRYLARLTDLAEDAEGIAQEVHASFLRPDYWSIIEDVLPLLEELKENRLRLAVVSNWDSNLKKLLNALGLGSYFDEVLSSASVGCRKPNPAIFALALDRMGLRPQEVVHVGDRPDADGIGAAAAGIKPVIFDQHRNYSGSDFSRIQSLRELPALVKKL